MEQALHRMITQEREKIKWTSNRRWQDDVVQKEGTTWSRIAVDRRQRRVLTEGYILQWMDNSSV